MINNIQVLRAFAALIVVAFHVVYVTNAYGFATQGWQWLYPWGAAGVDVFFVISGFIMVYTQTSKPCSAGSFFVSRLVRIVPLYWLMTAAMALLLMAMPSAFSENSFDPVHTLSSFGFMSGLFGFDFPVLQPGWTLHYEMAFYLLFALALLLVPGHLTAAVLGVLCLAVVLGADLIVLEFALGVVVALVVQAGRLARFGWACFAFGTVALAYSAFIGLQGSTGFDMQVHRFWLWGVPAAFLVLGACHIPQVSSRAVLFVGAASYSIYLVQAFSMPVFFKLISLANAPAMLGPLLIPLCIAFTALAGGLVYTIIERPTARYLIHRKVMRTAMRTASSLGFSSVAGTTQLRATTATGALRRDMLPALRTYLR